MDKIIDLHTHSTASDGSMSPIELVRYAKEKGLAAIALTDHDTIGGIQDALAEGDRIGLEVIPGIEISTEYKPELHILGLFINKYDYSKIINSLKVIKEGRDIRNKKIINRLNELGVEISEEEVSLLAVGEITGRPHIAQVLVLKRYVKTLDDAFDKYLGREGLAYFKRFELAPKEGIELIRNAGGIPIMAHPVFLRKSYDELDKLLMELKQYGLAGIEAFYSENTKEDTGKFLRLAIKHDLLVTGGSDFHGTYKTGIELGCGRGNLAVPYELLEKLKNYRT